MKNILDYLPVPEEKRKTFYSTNKSKGRGNVDPRVSEDAVRKILLSTGQSLLPLSAQFNSCRNGF